MRSSGFLVRGDPAFTFAPEHNLSDLATFNAPAGFFHGMGAPTSTREPGSLGTVVGLQPVPFRPDRTIDVIVVTDENDDSTAADFALPDTPLTGSDAVGYSTGAPDLQKDSSLIKNRSLQGV